MFIWPASASIPVKDAGALADGEVVDAGMAHFHEAGCVELPVLVAVGAKPIAASTLRPDFGMDA